MKTDRFENAWDQYKPALGPQNEQAIRIAREVFFAGGVKCFELLCAQEASQSDEERRAMISDLHRELMAFLSSALAKHTEH